MPERKAKITYEPIAIDSRRRVNGAGDSVVLLYDSINECYYETTVHSIVAGVERKANERIEAIQDEFNAYKEAMDKEMAEHKAKIAEELAKYKSDMSKAMSTLIEMVEASSAGE